MNIFTIVAACKHCQMQSLLAFPILLPSDWGRGEGREGGREGKRGGKGRGGGASTKAPYPTYSGYPGMWTARGRRQGSSVLIKNLNPGSSSIAQKASSFFWWYFLSLFIRSVICFLVMAFPRKFLQLQSRLHSQGLCSYLHVPEQNQVIVEWKVLYV